MSSGPSFPPAKRRIVICPTCGGDTVYSTENPYRPFCSDRCKSADFGAWASEHYRVPTPPAAPSSDPGSDGISESSSRIDL